MNLPQIPFFLMALATMACSSAKDEIPGTYAVEGEVSRTANLRIFSNYTYELCVDGCERGRLELSETPNNIVMIRFYGKKMNSYAREVFAKVVGSEMVTNIEGPPSELTEMNVETGIFGTSLILEPASNVIFRKVSD